MCAMHSGLVMYFSLEKGVNGATITFCYFYRSTEKTSIQCHTAAFGCSFQSKGNEGSNVSLHSFPCDKKRRKKWDSACGRIQLPKDSRLCSRHISPDARPQLLKELTCAAGYKRRLKPNTVPTIFSAKESKCPWIARNLL